MDHHDLDTTTNTDHHHFIYSDTTTNTTPKQKRVNWIFTLIGFVLLCIGIETLFTISGSYQRMEYVWSTTNNLTSKHDNSTETTTNTLNINNSQQENDNTNFDEILKIPSSCLWFPNDTQTCYNTLLNHMNVSLQHSRREFLLQYHYESNQELMPIFKGIRQEFTTEQPPASS